MNSEECIFLEIFVSVTIRISGLVASTRCAISHFFPLTLFVFVIIVTISLWPCRTDLRECFGTGVEWAAGLSGVGVWGRSCMRGS